MSTDVLERAFATTRKIVAKVTPDDLDKPTPCASWDVRALVNHIVAGSHWFASSTNAGVAAEGGDAAGTDFTAGDLTASYDEGIKASLAAFSAPGAQEKMVKLPFGEFPGAVFMGLATNDTFVHGWDLAKALGQPLDIDPEMAAQLLEQVRATIPDQFRGPDGQAPFGPVVECHDSLPAASRLAAFLGRTP